MLLPLNSQTMSVASEPLTESSDTSTHDFSIVVQNARAAQESWESLALETRVRHLRAIGRTVLRRAEEIASVLHEETGKPATEALFTEVLPVGGVADYWTQQIEQLLEPSVAELGPVVFPRKLCRTERIPHGVVAIITPYSSPFMLPLRHAIPAILAGNAVVLKPSHCCPRTADLIASLFTDTLPPHLVTVLRGGADTAQELIAKGVDAVCFTGSSKAGREVAVACARDFVPCSLEIGGKNPAIVLGDARIERTARGLVWAAFSNAGQSSASVERVFVVRSIADKLIDRVVAVTKTLQPSVDYGPVLVDERVEMVASHLSEAIDSGAEILTGGVPEQGSRLLAPTVVRITGNETSFTRLLIEETFGPVLPIVVVDDAEQAIEMANALPSGLAASVWTKRTRLGRVIARRLRAGVVTINNHGFTTAMAALPWASVGRSGNAIVHSPLALDSYTRPKLTLIDRNRRSRELWWHPYDRTLRRVAVQFARMVSGGFFGRIGAFFNLLWLVPKRWFGR